MIGARYIHLERINAGLFRLSIFTDHKGVAEFLATQKGTGTKLCESLIEHGHVITRTTLVDDLEMGTG